MLQTFVQNSQIEKKKKKRKKERKQNKTQNKKTSFTKLWILRNTKKKKKYWNYACLYIFSAENIYITMKLSSALKIKRKFDFFYLFECIRTITRGKIALILLACIFLISFYQ